MMKIKMNPQRYNVSYCTRTTSYSPNQKATDTTTTFLCSTVKLPEPKKIVIPQPQKINIPEKIENVFNSRTT
jgi:hypothetical protein